MPRFFGFFAQWTKASSCIISYWSSRSTMDEMVTLSFSCSNLHVGRFCFLVTGCSRKYVAMSFFMDS